MKQVYILTAILFFSITKSIGQITYVEIGENIYSADLSETNQFIPTTFDKAKVQFLFINAELVNGDLTDGSEITGIQWYVNTDNTSATSTYDLYIDDDFTNEQLSADATFATISPTLVADDITDAGQFTGWHTATFATPFIWDGTDNVILQMCREAGAQGTSDELKLATTSIYSCVTGYDHSCSSITGYYSEKYRPFFRLMVTTSTLSTTTSLDDQLENSIKCSPNPSSDFIEISGLNKAYNYSIVSINGVKIAEGIISGNERIDIKKIPKGFYFLKLDNKNTLKFIKE